MKNKMSHSSLILKIYLQKIFHFPFRIKIINVMIFLPDFYLAGMSVHK